MGSRLLVAALAAFLLCPTGAQAQNVNRVELNSAPTGANPTIAPVGPDTNLSLVFLPQGAGGGVGIGTTAPQELLHVYGNIRLRDGYALNWGSSVRIAANDAAGVLGLYTNGTERLRIDSNGNVGVGTPSATRKLVVQDTNTQFSLGDKSGYAAAYGPVIDTNSDALVTPSLVWIKGSNSYVKTESTWTRLHGDAGVKLSYYVTGVGMSVGLTMDNTGKVGIGTTSPLSALNVQSGSVNVGTYGVATTGTGVRLDTTGDLWMQQNTVDKVHLAVAGSSFINGGNVGIGTTSPATMLEVNSGAVRSSIKFGNGSGSGYLSVGTPGCFAGYIVLGRTLNPCGTGNDLMVSPSGTLVAKSWITLNANNGISDAINGGYALVVRNSSDKTVITNNGNYVFVADSSGKTGIGTSSPAATLDVNGYAKLKKNTAQPVACSATYEGSIALTSTIHMCVCDGTNWVDVDGRAACAW